MAYKYKSRLHKAILSAQMAPLNFLESLGTRYIEIFDNSICSPRGEFKELRSGVYPQYQYIVRAKFEKNVKMSIV